ncbi:MAG TPA: hypothetical protein VGH49_00385, partial [Xanthobacteraceae bacterium]
IFSIEVADRFGDQGLVGAAVIDQGDISGLVLSCRVLGLGVEHAFLRHIIEALTGECDEISGRITETSRNIPVRNIFRDHGFVCGADGLWRLRLCPAHQVQDRAVA